MKALSRIQFTFLFFLSLATIALLSRCGGVSSVYFDGRTCLAGIDSTSNGAQIYAVACANCHNALATTTKTGRSLAQLNTAISGVATMNFLSCMTESQRAAVVQALQPPLQ